MRASRHGNMTKKNLRTFDKPFVFLQALFVGYGPSFKNGETVQAFENIELYNMISGEQMFSAILAPCFKL